jgi:hypothetical protein
MSARCVNAGVADYGSAGMVTLAAVGVAKGDRVMTSPSAGGDGLVAEDYFPMNGGADRALWKHDDWRRPRWDVDLHAICSGVEASLRGSKGFRSSLTSGILMRMVPVISKTKGGGTPPLGVRISPVERIRGPMISADSIRLMSAVFTA